MCAWTHENATFPNYQRVAFHLLDIRLDSVIEEALIKRVRRWEEMDYCSEIERELNLKNVLEVGWLKKD